MKSGLFTNKLIHNTFFSKIFQKDTTNLIEGRQGKMQTQWRTIEVAPGWDSARGKD